MVFKIVWSSNALKSYFANVKYLEKDWTQREVKKFVDTVQRTLSILSLQPRIGKPIRNKYNVRRTVVHKRVILVYRLKPRKKEIELVLFTNTYQKPVRFLVK